MNKRELLRATLPALLALAAACGGSEPELKRATSMEGVIQLPPPKAKQVATYRCMVDLSTGQSEVREDKRTGKAEETAWKSVSPKIKHEARTYEVVIEQGEKNKKGATDWAFVTVVEKDAAGNVLRKIPVQEFWGAHDSQTPRALMMKEGRFQFFVQFWPAE